jgi:NAD(P)-dependent dehydrogenase (short-subunit alcohol dehydrogenase family)
MESKSMTGKRVLITGATSGIGFETAKAFVQAGADVSIVGRNPERVQKTADALKGFAPSGRVDWFLADLSSMASVRALAQQVMAKHDRIDVLINNAGAVNLKPERTVDGHELTFATNHLAYFLLTNLLLPALFKAPKARIVNVASEAHRGATFEPNDLMTEPYAAFRAYSRTKLMNILFTRELSRRLQGTSITANCLHPGVVASNFFAKPGLMGLLGKIAGLFMISSTEGAKTSIYLATSPEVEGVSGKYFDKCKERLPNAVAQDDEAAHRLWALSEKLTGLEQPMARVS